MTIPDLIKDFIDTNRERLKTPISGAFLLSFLIYNWRPIALLFISDASIEDKIVVINREYCNKWAILTPIMVALVYTILVPFCSAIIDFALVPGKKLRTHVIYLLKGDLLEKKIAIADNEFDLKNKLSGNKQIEDYLSQIKVLEESKEKIMVSHNVLAKDLSAQIDDLLKTVESSKKKEIDNKERYEIIASELRRLNKESNHIIKALSEMNKDDLTTLLMLYNKDVVLNSTNKQSIEVLRKLDLIMVSISGNIEVSPLGLSILISLDQIPNNRIK
ncbi:hypothetical protein SGQ83_01300 [Flavobacterium sp. Fl-318]|uniref:Uncharacterized protein n=1 Tax=Flavobacterium cupriresistens TaxID=2893885 RepID=A0ABU4R5V8_9FLAO|nr:MULTISPECIES: hypothetical protein [unclassified Flavobacterium]MDX6187971.1 hypothetical protein [Flavobacterium sp. Fl-318]UFH42109.1 hypothetical protein LNP23_20150 [Flavobacterium sp. F-323]